MVETDSEINTLLNKITLIRTLTIYFILLITIVVVLYKFVHIRFFSSLVFGLIICQIILNILYFPIYINYWSEFSSPLALYNTIQVLTPIIVYIYALSISVGDKYTVRY